MKEKLNCKGIAIKVVDEGDYYLVGADKGRGRPLLSKERAVNFKDLKDAKKFMAYHGYKAIGYNFFFDEEDEKEILVLYAVDKRRSRPFIAIRRYYKIKFD